MRVFQLLPTLAYGDGVGNDTIAIDKILKELGYDTKIYAENIDKRIPGSIAYNVRQMPEPCEQDVIIYHLSTGTSLNARLEQLQCRIVIIYHNITPPDFFMPYSQTAVELSRSGVEETKRLKECVEYCIADSEYNKQELIKYGYRCDISVVPIVIPFSDYEKPARQKIIDRFNDDYVNIIFVGRISPNKKQEDVIRTFYYYKKYINPESRLILIGSYDGMEKYKERLAKYAQLLELEDIYFTGHVKFDEILAYYRIASVFVCMSEHEGFCIPLLEAMYFQIPIIAYVNTGVKDTLGDCGLQLAEKDCQKAAEMINLVIEREDLRVELIEKQNIRLKEFSYENTRRKLTQCLEACLSGMTEN